MRSSFASTFLTPPKLRRSSSSLKVCGGTQKSEGGGDLLSSVTIKSRLSVRFVDEDMNVVHHYDAPGSPKTMWISNESRRRSERESKDAGRRAILTKKALLLNGTYVTKPKPEALEALNMFVRVSGARGMERVISEEQNDERRNDKTELFRAVFDAQDLADKNDWNPRKLRERVRDLSMRYSYRGKVFARNIALADEAALSPLPLKDIQENANPYGSGSRSVKKRAGRCDARQCSNPLVHHDEGGCRMFACF